ncbi:MAG: hypothetical protein MJ252_18400 [archaeon]|nr:hypothetical protein [archaeon]
MIEDEKKRERRNSEDEFTSASDNCSQIDSRENMQQLVSLALVHLISSNRSQPDFKKKLKKEKGSLFFCKTLPPISLGDYLDRILKYTKMDESTLVLSLIYIDRMCKNNKIFICEYNVHRIVLSSIVTAIKYHEDRFYKNDYYAKIGGITLAELNNLEAEFLGLIEFNLFVDSKIFEKYQRSLVQSC